MSYSQKEDYQSFKQQLPYLLKSQAGKFVVFHNKHSTKHSMYELMRFCTRGNSLAWEITSFKKCERSLRNQLQIHCLRDAHQLSPALTTQIRRLLSTGVFFYSMLVLNSADLLKIP